MKLTTLTSEQKNNLKNNKEKFVKKFLSNEKINYAFAKDVIKFIYSLIKKPMPVIYESANPLAAQLLANKLKGTSKKYYSFGTYLTIYWASWYAYYETFVDFGIITEKKFPKYFQLRKFIKSNIFMTIEFEKAIILVPKPIHCLKNENGMHCTTDYAIKWADGYGQCYVNGRKINKKLFFQVINDKFSFSDFSKLTNEDEKGIILTIIKENKGNEGLLNFLNATKVDEQIVNHENGYSETLKLFKTKEKYSFLQDSKGNSNQPYAWINMRCPSTNTEYLIDTCPTFTDVVKCAKWHRPTQVPESVNYKWQSAN